MAAGARCRFEGDQRDIIVIAGEPEGKYPRMSEPVRLCGATPANPTDTRLGLPPSCQLQPSAARPHHRPSTITRMEGAIPPIGDAGLSAAATHGAVLGRCGPGSDGPGLRVSGSRQTRSCGLLVAATRLP